MKNFYLFILLFILIGCKNSLLDSKTTSIIACPPILFSKEHKIYIDSKLDNITLNNISYKAEVNNAVFTKDCKIINDNFNGKISVLFVVNPLIQDQEDINLPFYIAMLDKENNIIDIDYFLTNGKFKKNLEFNSLKETEISTTEKVQFKLINEQHTVIIGFMLDEARLKLLD